MTRKDYEAIASAISEVATYWQEAYKDDEPRDILTASVMGRVSWELSRVLADTNPRFDMGRFVNACKGKSPNYTD